jgi:hypothetical protein
MTGTEFRRTSARWIPAALCAAVLYPAVGVTFTLLDRRAGPAPVRPWRVAAWIAGGAVFAAHLLYEHLRRRSSPSTAALHAAAAVAAGAFLLAVWINLHRPPNEPGRQRSLVPLALVVFPAVTGIPAFLAGLVSVAALARLRRRGR